MTKKLLLLALVSGLSCLIFALPPQWEAYQKDIGIQAGQFRDSALHQEYRQRDTRNYVVGDTKTFWRWNLSVMPPTWIQTPSTCRAVGAHSYVFVADSEWNVHMTQANIDTIMVRLEQNTPNNPNQGAIAMDIDLFGPIPDELDNDPKLIVFYSALGSFQGNYFDGYFSAYNQVPEAQAQQMNPPGHSNECEMIYMTCYPLSPIAPIRLSVLAHELEHLIHWGQDPYEESWLDEGCAELAMVAYGVPDPISGFNSNADNDLTAWNQTTADYVKVMLFFTYLQEHYDQTGLISDLVADPTHGINSFTTQLAAHFPALSVGEVLRNWNIANALDDLQPADGLYNYLTLDLPSFSMTNVNVLPNQTNQGIQAYAADYLKFARNNQTNSITIQSSAPIIITTLLMNDIGQCYAVLDGTPTDYYNYNPLPLDAYNYIMVLTNHNSSAVTYSYSSTSVAIQDELVPHSPSTTLSSYPNPFNPSCTIEFSLAQKSPAKLEIFNLRGQKVRSLLTAELQSGLQRLQWDGRDDNANPLSSGIYYIRLIAGTQVLTHKTLMLK